MVTKNNEEDPIAIASIPVMVKSKYCSTTIKKDSHNECKYDPGGYFLVNGKEKVVMSIEKMVDNKPLVFTKKDSSFPRGHYFTCQINSKANDWSDNLQILNIKEKKDSTFVISTSQLSDIKIIVLMRALGLETDQDIISNFCYSLDDINMINLIKPSIDNSVDDEGNVIRTKDQAIDYLITKLRRNKRFSQSDEELAVKQKDIFRKIFRKDLLPHLGEDIKLKIRFICIMFNKMFKVMLKREEQDDRDALQNKRIETPGVLIGQLFRQNWKKLLNEIGKNFKKKNQSDENPVSVINQIKPNSIEQGIKTALSTGIWGMNKTKKGVAQALQRLSWFGANSYLRRVMAPSLDNTTSNITKIRLVNNLQAQFLCPTETPEGQNIGIIKSLSMSSTITMQNDSQLEIVKEIIKKFGKSEKPTEISPLEISSYGKVFMNGNWIAVTKEPYELYTLLKKNRQEGILDKFTSVYLDFMKKEIGIFSDGGRLIRPILQVENNKVNMTKEVLDEINKQIDTTKESAEVKKGNSWNILMDKFPELLEYEDIESSNYLMIAQTPYDLVANEENKNRDLKHKDVNDVNRYGDYRYVNYTHCDIHPWLMLGYVVCSIPFSNHNFGLKNIIFFSQAKQSIGVYLTSYKDRMDISQILYHPQVPLVTTEGMRINNSMDLPFGENVVIAIMSYMGYNQEDSIIFNKASVDRGLFLCDSLKKEHAEIVKNPSTSQDDIFTKPDSNKVTGMQQGNYDKLNDKGFVPEETIIDNQDIIIGKVSPIQPTGTNNKVYKDNSVQFKSNVEGVIDRVHTGVYNNDGYEMYNVRLRMERVPIIGDKFSNRHGQKGTLGILLPERDMPFTESGMVPDLIMNPHGIPSRMTHAQILECLASKYGAITGQYVDGTPFNNYDVSKLPDMLKSVGFKPYGTETMYCGITGKKMQSEIFIGPTYYMRLKHMVLDKVHSRSIGPKQAITRQPLEGRSRDGGLKIGEMEKDSMIAHGVGQFLKERLNEVSDITKVHICDVCGRFASKVFDKDYYYCEGCDNSTRISAVSMPYACKLLFQEITSVNIQPRIRTRQSVFEANV